MLGGISWRRSGQHGTEYSRFPNERALLVEQRVRKRGVGSLGRRQMFEVSRRDLVLSSLGAGLAFGLNGPVSFIGAAHAQRAADSLKYKVGDIEVFSLHDGNTERVIDAAYVKNAALEDVKGALSKAGMNPDKIPN